MNSKEDSKENISDIEILDNKRKIDKITSYIDEHKGIIEQVDILKGHFDASFIEETLAQKAINKIESDMNKITLGRITEVIE